MAASGRPQVLALEACEPRLLSIEFVGQTLRVGGTAACTGDLPHALRIHAAKAAP